MSSKLAVAALAMLACAATGAAAQEVSFRGKTISLIINSNPGGGTDLAARLTGNALAKHLPGNPTVVYRNLPGGGGLKANNYFATQVQPDGMTLLAGSRTQISPAKLRGPQVQYDPSKYEFVGGDANLGTVMMIRREAQPRLTDPKAEPVVYGDIDGTRSGLLISLWAKEFLGWNIRWVVGYSGTSTMLMALQSGELHMAANQNAFTLGPLMKSGQFVGVAQLGAIGDDGKRVRRDAFADVPLLDELILPKLPEDKKAIYLGMQADFAVNKWLALPPGTPKPVVEVYRAAYTKSVKDPDFLALATKQIDEDFTPLSGEQVAKIVADLAATTDADLEYIVQLLKKYNLPVK